MDYRSGRPESEDKLNRVVDRRFVESLWKQLQSLHFDKTESAEGMIWDHCGYELEAETDAGKRQMMCSFAHNDQQGEVIKVVRSFMLEQTGEYPP